MSGEERLGDALFTGLRLTEGVDLDGDSRPLRRRRLAAIRRRTGRFVDAGLLRRDGDRLRLTRQGMLLAHEVMTVFV